MYKRPRGLAFSLCLSAILILGGAQQSAHAAITGVAVSGVGGGNVGVTEYRDVLGGDAIGYFIPLTGSACVYGVAGCGLSADSVTVSAGSTSNGPIISMWLKFDPVLPNIAGDLEIAFEDLDLRRANDPAGFFERIRIYDQNGTILVRTSNQNNWITRLGQGGTSGDAVQQLLLVTSVLPETNPFYVELQFRSRYKNDSWHKVSLTNTKEYLTATFNQTLATPLPAAAWMFLAGIGGLGAMRARKRKHRG